MTSIENLQIQLWVKTKPKTFRSSYSICKRPCVEPMENPCSHFIWQAQLVLGRDAGEDSKTSERAVQGVIPGGGGIVQWLETQALEPDFLGANFSLPHAGQVGLWQAA